MRSSGVMPTAGSRSANGKRKAGLKHDVEETGPPETQPTLSHGLQTCTPHQTD